MRCSWLSTRAASVAWLPDGSGFWYAVYPEGDEYHRHIHFHRLGTAHDFHRTIVKLGRHP